jgi:hypothetical protein
MMAIIKEQVPYEVLVRFNADGTVRGRHIRYLDRIIDTDTNEVYAEKEGVALSVGDESSAVLLETALGQVNAALLKSESERQLRQAKEAELEAEKQAHQKDEQDLAGELSKP